MILMVYTIIMIITLTYGLPTGPVDKFAVAPNVSIIQLNVYNQAKGHDNYALVDDIPSIPPDTEPKIESDPIELHPAKIKTHVLYKKTLEELLIKLTHLFRLAELENKELHNEKVGPPKDEGKIDNPIGKVTEGVPILSKPNHPPKKDDPPSPIMTSTSSSTSVPPNSNSIPTTTPSTTTLGISTTAALNPKTTNLVTQENTVSTENVSTMPTSTATELEKKTDQTTILETTSVSSTTPKISVTTSSQLQTTQLVPQNETTSTINSTPTIVTTTTRSTITVPQQNEKSTEKSIPSTVNNTSTQSPITTSTTPSTTTKKPEPVTTEKTTTAKEEEKTTTVNWLKWCQNQCRLGTGGTACDCDIIP